MAAEAPGRRAKLADLVGRPAGAKREETSAPDLLTWARDQPRRGATGGMVLLIPNLFLGNKQAAANRGLLTEHGIGSICAVGARKFFSDGEFAYHHISIEDDELQSMLRYFSAACDFIHNGRARGAVLVHCKGGISRSPTMVIAYLMKYGELSFQDAIEVCSLARPAARPRENFLRDLSDFAGQLAGEIVDASAKEERHRWEEAAALATEEAVANLGVQEVSTRQEVQAECRRLLTELQTWCAQEIFGETRDANEDLQEAAKVAVKRFAQQQGWTKL